MQTHEYTVIPAPSRGEKARSAKTGAERFSYALLLEMNRMAADGWEYIRAETLPCEERSGLTSRTTVYHNVLVFRRALPREYPRQYAPDHGAALAVAPAEPSRAPEPPPTWPDGPAGNQTPTGQPVPDRTHVPERVSADDDHADLLVDHRGDDAAQDDAPERDTRPHFGEAMPRPLGSATTPESDPPNRLGPAER